MTRHSLCKPVLSRGRKALVALVAAASLLGAGWAVYQETMQPVPLENLIPESALAFGSGDARWLWEAVADLRATDPVRQGIASAEEELGLSMESDVVPWAGQVGGALLDINPKQPMFALFVEVRNPVSYYMTMTRVRTRMEREASRYWKGTGYNGVPLRYAYLGQGAGRVPVSTAWLKGWLVIGVGNGSTKRVIDAWQGRKPTLADNGAWAGVLSKTPTERVMLYGVNGRIMSASTPGYEKLPANIFEMSRSVTAGAVTEIEDGFRTSTYSVATSPEARSFFDRLARIRPVDHSISDRLPDGTFMSYLLTDAGAWWDAYEPILRASFMSELPAEGDREVIDAALERYKPIEDIIRRCGDGLAIGLAHRPDGGFGLVLAGDFGTAEAARESAEELRAFIQKFDQQVTLSEDRSTYKLFMEEQAPDGVPVKFRPAWSVSGRFVTFGSHESWLEPGTGMERLPMPSEAEGAQFFAKGNFGFVEPAVRSFKPGGTPAGAPEMDTFFEIWDQTGLGNARWWSAGRIHENGTSESVSELTGWRWRDALKALAAEINEKSQAGGD